MDYPLKQSFTEDKFLRGQVLSDYTTFKIGGRSKYFYKPKTVKDFIGAINYCKEKDIECKIIGNGSNLLCSDLGFDGLTLCTKNLKRLSVNGNKIRCYSGVLISKLLAVACSNGLGGMEPLIGIPATVGAGTVMNAGAFGYNISDNIDRVCVYDGEKIFYIGKNDCKFFYRDSALRKKKYVVVFVDFILNKTDKALSEKRMKDYVKLRRESQPIGNSCGSVFKNPKGYTAGKLIESVSLKGERVGGAFVSQKHANFIINDGTATAEDVATLIGKIKNKVKKIYKIDLEEEVEYVGNFNGIKR